MKGTAAAQRAGGDQPRTAGAQPPWAAYSSIEKLRTAAKALATRRRVDAAMVFS
jgi:hypothetical protein